MKKKISKIFALALTAIFIIAACGACNEGTTEGSQPQNNGAQGNSGQENTKSSTGDGSGQNSTENGTGSGAGQNSAENGTGGTESELKDVSLRVVIYSNTKADFIIENAVFEPDSDDRIEIDFETNDGHFSVTKGADDNLYSRCDYTYAYNGEQLTITVDMLAQGIPFHFKQVKKYNLTYYYSLNGERLFKEFSFAAADIVKDEGGALSLTCSLQVIHYDKKSARFIVDNAPLAHGSGDTYQVIFGTKDGTYCYQVRDFGNAENFAKELCKSVNADNTEFEVVNGDYGNTSYFKTDGDRLVINVNLLDLEFDLNEVREFTVRYIKNSGYDGQAEITFAASDVRTSPLEWFKYADDGNGGIVITGLNSDGTEFDGLYIPGTIDGKPVTTINSIHFHYKSNVFIPDSVTKINKLAFNGGNITGWLTIPESVTEIGEEAFYNCINLTGLTISGGKAVIGSYAFYKCGLVDVDIDVKTIGDHAFYVNDNLASVNIKAETIGEEAFANFLSYNLSEDRGSFSAVISAEIIGKSAFEYSGIKDLTLMDGVREIGEEAFKDCWQLTDFTFPDSVTVLGSNAFKECHSLTNVIYPKNITVINNAFYRCRGVVSVTLPETVTEIGYGAFAWWSITDIRIPDGCTSIGADAFYFCEYLSNVYVPDSVKEIGGGAFYDCTKLKKITLPKGVKLQGGENSVFRFSPTKVTYR